MSDFILVDGDTVTFMPSFGPAIVVVAPGTLSGSGPAKIGGKAACVDGDETNVKVQGCAYTSGAFTIPGVGTLMIDALGGDQKAQKTKTGGKAVLLKGSTFTAKFQVTAPATNTSPTPAPDPVTMYSGGSGTFMNTNTTVKGS
jgi:hypothetical protein